MQKLVIASSNYGKLRELQAMLAPLDIELFTQSQLGIAEAEEPHGTFIENALAKARHVSIASGLPALADDSGICVTALGGAPGVLSARYAEECGNSCGAASSCSAETVRKLPGQQADACNNEKLLQAMQGVTDRRAHYYCVLVLMRHGGDPQPLIAEGEWHGEIALEARGDGGFGYDPLFWLPQIGKTSAELDRDEKSRISHRALALQILLRRLTPHAGYLRKTGSSISNLQDL